MIGLRKSAALIEQRVFLRKGGVLVEQEVYLRKGGALQLISSPVSNLVAVPSELEVYGGRSIDATVAVTTFGTTVVVTGGVAPYSFNWARTDGGGETWEILADGASARFRCNCAPGDEFIATFACTVTPARGSPVTTVDVQATVHNFGGFGGGPL